MRRLPLSSMWTLKCAPLPALEGYWCCTPLFLCIFHEGKYSAPTVLPLTTCFVYFRTLGGAAVLAAQGGLTAASWSCLRGHTLQWAPTDYHLYPCCLWCTSCPFLLPPDIGLILWCCLILRWRQVDGLVLRRCLFHWWKRRHKKLKHLHEPSSSLFPLSLWNNNESFPPTADVLLNGQVVPVGISAMLTQNGCLRVSELSENVLIVFIACRLINCREEPRSYLFLQKQLNVNNPSLVPLFLLWRSFPRLDNELKGLRFYEEEPPHVASITRSLNNPKPTHLPLQQTSTNNYPRHPCNQTTNQRS